jgi:hypothetical protein
VQSVLFSFCSRPLPPSRVAESIAPPPITSTAGEWFPDRQRAGCSLGRHQLGVAECRRAVRGAVPRTSSRSSQSHGHRGRRSAMQGGSARLAASGMGRDCVGEEKREKGREEWDEIWDMDMIYLSIYPMSMSLSVYNLSWGHSLSLHSSQHIIPSQPGIYPPTTYIKCCTTTSLSSIASLSLFSPFPLCLVSFSRFVPTAEPLNPYPLPATRTPSRHPRCPANQLTLSHVSRLTRTSSQNAPPENNPATPPLHFFSLSSVYNLQLLLPETIHPIPFLPRNSIHHGHQDVSYISSSLSSLHPPVQC